MQSRKCGAGESGRRISARRWKGSIVVAAAIAGILRSSSAFAYQPAVDSNKETAAHLRPVSAGEANRAAQLFGRHCAACHGVKGDGNGAAARFLEPRPRNLRDGRFRLISSATTSAASAKDVLEVLDRGMPGSSMPSWTHLPPMDRMLLVGQVLQYRQDGLLDKAAAMLKEEGEEVTEAGIRQYAAKLVVKSGPPLQVPEPPPSTSQLIEHGKTIFGKACAACHGTTGKGDGVQQMLTSEGFLQRPRDLTRGIFKGNHDPASLFRRIRLGLPGSAMPSNGQNSDAEIGAMVAYILSLSDEATRQSFVTVRKRIEALRVSELLDAPADARWDSIAFTSTTLFPLWWRDFEHLKFQVQAIHDGKSIVVRLCWRDRTQDDDPRRTDAFEDMAAVQWYRGVSEPFLGMGDASEPVEAWLWRASWHRPEYREGVRVSDEYPFDGPNYDKLFPGKRTGFPNGFTARAAGNLSADVGQTLSATSLAAKGLGTTTLRPRFAQKIVAQSARGPEGWSVTFRRPLEVDGNAGISLKPGDRVSVAFAIWDGAAKDRNGQKMISIWNDIVLQR